MDGRPLGIVFEYIKKCYEFMINLGNATAFDLEELGETVRERVKKHSGVDLRWEIRRIGERLGHSIIGKDA